MAASALSVAILWLNFLAFALLTAGFGAELLSWLRTLESWRSHYLLTILGYVIVLFDLSLAFFSRSYLAAPPAFLPYLLGWIHTLSSLLIAYAFPGAVVRIAGLETRRMGRLLLWLPAVLTTASILVGAFFASRDFAVAVNIAFNGVMAGVALLGAARVSRGRGSADRREALPFLVLSSGAYLAFILLAGLVVSGLVPQSDAVASPFVMGLFGLAMSVVLLASAARRTLAARQEDAASARGAAAVHEAFFERSGLSPREAEVARLLVAGRTNREIGEALFVSTRTVETHVYNAYRKCGCRNKAEFVAKALTFGHDKSHNSQIAPGARAGPVPPSRPDA